MYANIFFLIFLLFLHISSILYTPSTPCFFHIIYLRDHSTSTCKEKQHPDFFMVAFYTIVEMYPNFLEPVPWW